MKRTAEQAYEIRVASRLAAFSCMLCFGILAEAIDLQYQAELERRQDREADAGWLKVTGVFWLKEGINTLGSDAASDILLPEESPERFGDLQVKDGKVLFVSAGASVRYYGKAVDKAEMRTVGSDVFPAAPSNCW